MKICLGTVSFGLDYGVKGGRKPSLDDAVAMLESAVFECGIDCFDTAAAYGQAETVLGTFFERYPECKDTVSVISKLAPDAFVGNKSTNYPEIMRRNINTSLLLLNLDQLDGYMLHNAAQALNPYILESLSKLKELGLVKNVGVSCYLPEEARRAAQNLYMDDVQIPFNAIDHRLFEKEFFSNAGSLRIFARSIFLQGLLLMDTLPAHMGFAGDVVRKFQEIAQQYNLSYSEACLMFAASIPRIEYIVIGIESISELKQNIAALEKPVNNNFINDCKSAFVEVNERILMPNLWSEGAN